MIPKSSPDSPIAFFHHYHARKAQFKPGIDPSQSRQNRIKTNFQIRKIKRSDLMTLKRFQSTRDSFSLIESNHPNCSMDVGMNQHQQHHHREDELYMEWKGLTDQRIRDLQDTDPYVILAATRGLRKSILQEARLTFVQALHSSSEVLKALVGLLRHSDTLILQESLWILTNIVSEEFVAGFVLDAMKLGITNDLKLLMRHKKRSIRNAAVLLFGNLAGDSLTSRDSLLADSLMLQSVLDMTSSSHDQESVNLLAFAVYNLFRDHDGQFPSFQRSRVLIPLLTLVTNNSKWNSIGTISEPDALVYSCASLESFTQANDDRIDRVQCLLDHDIMNDIKALVNNRCEDIVSYTSKILVNLTQRCSVDQIRVILESGVIRQVQPQLTHGSHEVRQHLCTFISNVAAISGNHNSYLIHTNHNIVSDVIHLARNDVYSVRIPALRVLIQICNNKELPFGQIEYLVHMGIMDALVSVFTHEMDVTTLLGAIDALSSVLSSGNMANTIFFRRVFEECDGLDKLESMQFHKNSEIFTKVSLFLDRYFLKEKNVENDGNMEDNEDDLTFEMEGNLVESLDFAYAS